MTHDDAFLQAILEDPADDSLRLIYADYLDERDDPRGEFIRVQCALAKSSEEDPRRQELEARERELLDAHREDWVHPFGLAMSWENTLSMFRWRLAQTMAWCRGRNVESLRTPALEPAVLCGWDVTSAGPVWRSQSRAERQATVNTLANRRAQLLAGDGRHARTCKSYLAGGRLLLCDPDGTLSDGAAVPETEGFFDDNNYPAWDTWVWYAEDRNPQEDGWTPFTSYLVAWVPPHLVELANWGIRVNPEQCIKWASEVATAFTRRLRAAGLLTW